MSMFVLGMTQLEAKAAVGVAASTPHPGAFEQNPAALQMLHKQLRITIVHKPISPSLWGIFEDQCLG